MATQNITPPASNGLKVTRKKLRDYLLDPRNPNKGTPKGTAALEYSVGKFGPARSGVADKDGIIRAGNHTAEELAAAGIEDVIEVETSGKEWVVVKRADMDADTARQYGIADNRTSEVGLAWDEKVLHELEQEGVNLEQFWSEDELNKLLKDERANNTSGNGSGGPELKISPELFERQDYLVILVENQFDWNVLVEKLGIGPVLCGPVGNKTIAQRGLGRVVRAEKLLELLK